MFDFVDLFAGIGGFHAALSSLGGRGVQAAEIDPAAARVYGDQWGLLPERDVRDLAADPANKVLRHAVLAGGFPCQPFSKSGRQLGMSEDRGTLFHDVVSILKVKRPPVVMLENVRNIAGPRQRESWRAVVEGLREAGYAVSGTPCVFSPHLLPPEAGGAAQIRDRVYILGTYVGEAAKAMTELAPALQRRPVLGWDPQDWSIKDHVIACAEPSSRLGTYRLSDDENEWIDTWNDLLRRLGASVRLPGHPLWSDVWFGKMSLEDDAPAWKKTFYDKNVEFFRENTKVICEWAEANPILHGFPASRRKFEWQAQDGPRDLRKLLLHFRPSGIRAKRPTYAPALVAMGQTSVYGDGKTSRRLTVQEAAVLQGFPRSFRFGAQVDSLSYRQLGNAVNVGTARYVLATYVRENAEMILQSREAGALVEGDGLVQAVLQWHSQQQWQSEATA